MTVTRVVLLILASMLAWQHRDAAGQAATEEDNDKDIVVVEKEVQLQSEDSDAATAETNDAAEKTSTVKEIEKRLIDVRPGPNRQRRAVIGPQRGVIEEQRVILGPDNEPKRVLLQVHPGEAFERVVERLQRNNEDTEGEATVPSADRSSQIRIFPLNRARAQSVAEMLERLIPGDRVIVAEERTNSLVVRGSADQLNEIGTLVQRLDASPRRGAEAGPYGDDPAPRPRAEGRPGPRGPGDGEADSDDRPGRPGRGPRPGSGFGGFGLRGQDRQPAPPGNRIELEVREEQGPPRGWFGGRVRVREFTAGAQGYGDVKDQVTREFEERQALQRAELAQLRERLERVEQQIAEREQIRDQIIEHRVEELLNPEMRWDDGPQSPLMQAAPGGQPPARIRARTPGIPGMPGMGRGPMGGLGAGPPGGPAFEPPSADGPPAGVRPPRPGRPPGGGRRRPADGTSDFRPDQPWPTVPAVAPMPPVAPVQPVPPVPPIQAQPPAPTAPAIAPVLAEPPVETAPPEEEASE